MAISLSACNSAKKIVYAQNAGLNITFNDSTNTIVPEPRIKTGDLLIITVNTATPEAAIAFNLPLIPNPESMKSYTFGANMSISGGTSLQNYLVDDKGNITFPTIGQIHVLGMTKTELADCISAKIHPFYIKENPIITIRYANFKISVLGEVGKPGAYEIRNEKVNIFEAIALSGDLTIFGQRDNVLLVRENQDGKRECFRIDLRDSRLINSPYFYLQQNDVLYVQPNAPKSRSSALSTAETLSVSVVGTLISLATLVLYLVK